MFINRIRISGFRNIKPCVFSPSKGINLFTGENSQGKSSFLEAVSFIANGRSFRTSRDEDMINYDAEAAVVEAEICQSDKFVRIKAVVARKPNGIIKNISLEGKTVKALSEFVGKISNSIYSRDDINVAIGSPAARRYFIDRLLSFSDPLYLQSLKRYEHAMKQKNQALKSAHLNEDLLDILNLQMSEYASEIQLARTKAVSILSEKAEKLYNRLFETEIHMSARYAPSVHSSATDKNILKNEIALAFKKAAGYEKARKLSLLGPHRDDFLIYINNRPVKFYASQGQQKITSLIFRLAESIIIKESTNTSPIIFMDDCYSELDDMRRIKLTEYLAEQGQTFIASGEKTDERLIASKYQIKNGEIIDEFNPDRISKK